MLNGLLLDTISIDKIKQKVKLYPTVDKSSFIHCNVHIVQSRKSNDMSSIIIFLTMHFLTKWLY